MPSPLFTVPINASSPKTSPVGTVVCSQSSSGVYILTFTSPPDNRLLTSFCQALLLALDILEFSYPPGCVITTSGIQKFFSNGLDLEHAFATEGFFPDSMFALFRRLLTYPMPTVAVVNGHAFAGGFMLAMYHDYSIMNPSRGYLCLNELDLGVPLQAAMSSVFRQKLSPAVYKAMVLEAKRYSGQQALDNGIVDALGGMEEALKFVEERKLREKGTKGVYGLLKKEMWRESLCYLEKKGYEKEVVKDKAYLKSEEERIKAGKKRFAEWTKNATKAKL